MVHQPFGVPDMVLALPQLCYTHSPFPSHRFTLLCPGPIHQHACTTDPHGQHQRHQRHEKQPHGPACANTQGAHHQLDIQGSQHQAGRSSLHAAAEMAEAAVGACACMGRRQATAPTVQDRAHAERPAPAQGAAETQSLWKELKARETLLPDAGAWKGERAALSHPVLGVTVAACMGCGVCPLSCACLT